MSSTASTATMIPARPTVVGIAASTPPAYWATAPSSNNRTIGQAHQIKLRKTQRKRSSYAALRTRPITVNAFMLHPISDGCQVQRGRLDQLSGVGGDYITG